VAHTAVFGHFRELGDTCTVLITHEWWSLHLDLMASRMFPATSVARVPYTVRRAALPNCGERNLTRFAAPLRARLQIVNVHGGTIWSSSWDNITQRALADWVLPLGALGAAIHQRGDPQHHRVRPGASQAR
jgi:hypothetical protein